MIIVRFEREKRQTRNDPDERNNAQRSESKNSKYGGPREQVRNVIDQIHISGAHKDVSFSFTPIVY